MRVSLTFEYLTDSKMRFGRRMISNMKDAFGYFGFRQVFRRATFAGRRRTGAAMNGQGGSHGSPDE